MPDDEKKFGSLTESFRALDDAKSARSQRPLNNKPPVSKPVHVGPVSGVVPGPEKDVPKKKDA